MASLLRELRRRNVLKVAVAYAIVGWLFVLAPTVWANDPPGTLHPASLRQRLQTAVAAKAPDYRPRTEHLHPDGSPLYTNRLILEDSPYLLQHAHNPVNWYAWGPEAFTKASRENKPLVPRHGAREF